MRTPQRRLAHLLDALFAQVVGQFAGDDLQVELRELLLQHRRELRADVVGGGNVAAEDHRVKTAREPILQDQLGRGEFLVLLDGAQVLQLLRKVPELLALVAGPVVCVR